MKGISVKVAKGSYFLHAYLGVHTEPPEQADYCSTCDSCVENFSIDLL